MKKILIVDDLENNRKLLRHMLATIGGHAVIEASNGLEAITLFKQESPDLILMDVNMPDMDGYQSATAIKKIAGEQYIPIIFVTALSEEASLTKSLSSGGDDFIGKPFNVAVLESKIESHLRICELNQNLLTLNKHLTYEQSLIEHFFGNSIKQSEIDERVVKYHMSSMSTFNGDLFLSARGLNGEYFIIVGDFTGHGLTAAMGTMPVAMIFFKMVKEGASIGDIARELNIQLKTFLPISMFFAATLVEINDQGNSVSVWMGSMPKSYWIGSSGELKGEIQSKHLALGILDGNSFDPTVENYIVEEGDKIYLYSDGITEAEAPNGEMFGDERLKQILLSVSNNQIDHVLAELTSFKSISAQSDDITLVEITCRNTDNI